MKHRNFKAYGKVLTIPFGDKDFGGITRRHEAGESLVSVMIASAIGLTVLGVALEGMTTIFKSNKSSSIRQEIMNMQSTIRTQFDCGQTLGVPPATLAPTCAAAVNLAPKDKSGNMLVQLGNWVLTASCVISGSPGNPAYLAIRATQNGVVDPLRRNLLVNDIPTGGGNTVSTDLMGGTLMCSSYWGPGGVPVAVGSAPVTGSACPTGQVVQNVDFTSQAVVCGPPTPNPNPLTKTLTTSMTRGPNCLWNVFPGGGCWQY